MDRMKNPKSVEPGRPAQNNWETFVAIYNEFAAATSIHGLKYITQRKLKVDGIIWIAIVSISLICAGLLANRFYERHRAASMRTTVVSNQFPAWELTFPAVTLCHGTMIAKRKLETFLKTGELSLPRGVSSAQLQEAMAHAREIIRPTNKFPLELNKLQNILNTNHLSVHDLLKSVGPNCTDYLIMCIFEGRTTPCDRLITPSLTPYGQCCSFNYALASDQQESTSDRYNGNYNAVIYGTRFVLSFLIDPLINERVSSTIFGDGIKVLIHEPYTYPGDAAIEFVVPSGFETITTVHGNRLISSGEVLNLAANVRNCIKSGEQNPPYRSDNCHAECREQSIKRACGCHSFFALTRRPNDEVCNFTHVQCVTRAQQEFTSSQLRNPECRCLPECEENTYAVATTALPLTAARFTLAPLYKETRRYSNATVLHVTLSGQAMTLQRRDVIQSWINLLSSLGGVFSLFLGCSFVSLMEIVYFFCIRFPSQLKLNRKRQHRSTKLTVNS